MKYLLLIVCLLTLILGIGAGAAPPALATYAQAHDNSTNPAKLQSWTHGDPNTGLAPGYGADNNGYYYLKAYAPSAPSGGVVMGNCEVYSGGDWEIRIEDHAKHVLMQTVVHGAGARAWATNLTPGALYLCRISNIGWRAQKDYAELHLWLQGDMTTSDCGGPGVVWDPNYNQFPMEPAHTAGLPPNGCNGAPGAAPYDPTDPRAAPPPDQAQYDLGVNHGSATYAITTTRTGDLTAFVFFGHQGTPGTLWITDATGRTVNGARWGAQTPNPNTLDHEFVGADAGVQPPGVYLIHWTGPSNSQHVWALVGQA